MIQAEIKSLTSSINVMVKTRISKLGTQCEYCNVMPGYTCPHLCIHDRDGDVCGNRMTNEKMSAGCEYFCSLYGKKIEYRWDNLVSVNGVRVVLPFVCDTCRVMSEIMEVK